MAIKKEHQAALEKALGLPDGELEKIIKDTDEKELDITGFTILKTTDYEQRITNVGNTKFEEGKKTGKELLIKDIRSEFGIDKDALSKTADPKKIKEVVFNTVSTELKLPPDTKVKELNEEKEKLIKKNQEWENKYSGLEQTIVKREKVNGVKATLFAKAPDNLVIDKEDAFTLGTQKKGITIDFDADAVVFKKNGVVMKSDKTFNPLTPEEVAPVIFNDYVKPAAGGSGDKDDPGQAKPGTFAAFKERMAKENITSGSEKYMKELNKTFPDGKIPA